MGEHEADHVEDRWEVALRGGQAALRELARLYGTGRHQVVQQGGGYVLRSKEFGVIGDPTRIKERAQELVGRMVGCVRTRGVAAPVVEAVSVQRAGPGGRTVYLGAAISAGSSMDLAAATVRDEGGNEAQPAIPMEVGVLDPDVATVLDLLNREPDWHSRYEILEFLMLDLSGTTHPASNFMKLGMSEAEGRGWATTAELTDLAKTANWHGTPEGRPRHTVPTRQGPPQNSLTPEQADRLTRKVARLWLEDRLTGSNP
jgi:hypothetical protein